MDAEVLKQARRELARLGGIARTKSMTAKERKELATKASRAAAAARKKKSRKKAQPTKKPKNKTATQWMVPVE